MILLLLNHYASIYASHPFDFTVCWMQHALKQGDMFRPFCLPCAIIHGCVNLQLLCGCYEFIFDIDRNRYWLHREMFGDVWSQLWFKSLEMCLAQN